MKYKLWNLTWLNNSKLLLSFCHLHLFCHLFKGHFTASRERGRPRGLFGWNWGPATLLLSECGHSRAPAKRIELENRQCFAGQFPWWDYFLYCLDWAQPQAHVKDWLNSGVIYGQAVLIFISYVVLFLYTYQAYKIALESLGHCEYAMKAGFHLNPKAIEESLQVRASFSGSSQGRQNRWVTIKWLCFALLFCVFRAAAVKLKLSRLDGDRLPLSLFSVSCPQFPSR